MAVLIGSQPGNTFALPQRDTLNYGAPASVSIGPTPTNITANTGNTFALPQRDTLNYGAPASVAIGPTPTNITSNSGITPGSTTTTYIPTANDIGLYLNANPDITDQQIKDALAQYNISPELIAQASPDAQARIASATAPVEDTAVSNQSSAIAATEPTSLFDTSLDIMKRSAEGTEALASYTPDTVTAGTLPGVDISQYMDPYIQEVIDTSLSDLERQRLIQQQGIGAQAQAAGAFGGSRMGIQEAMTNEAFARQAGTLAAGLRSAGFTQAQNLAQTDLARQMQADLANQGAGLQGAQFQLGAYNQMGGMGLTGYNLANQQMNQFMANEAMKQGLQTNLYGQQVGQATGFFGQPVQSLPYVSAALGASPMPQTTMQSYSPGTFDYLTLGAYMFPR